MEHISSCTTVLNAEEYLNEEIWTLDDTPPVGERIPERVRQSKDRERQWIREMPCRRLSRGRQKLSNERCKATMRWTLMNLQVNESGPWVIPFLIGERIPEKVQQNKDRDRDNGAD
eukprot:gnl/MRDRNA2_/MRDRNA2_243985_c0_seq1.p2 gnl/MRDRNA2_/MRDRNA2_243985_c0~~gnl/MRDRNA2_/MRDRNA2_243985_c0_seq1.p2  ORF type:complete len:116 (+),score=9.05 gnl/MRDRNA2_/MRDRNA2_243985_c0_seq1:205-552(+)